MGIYYLYKKILILYVMENTLNDPIWIQVMQVFGEMMDQRGYSLTSSLEKIPIIYTDTDMNDIHLFILFNEKLNVQIFRMCHKEMEIIGCKHSIIITKNIITPSTLSLIETMKNLTELEVFKTRELVKNITKHILVPLHLKMDLKDKEDMLKKYKIKTVSLPKINYDDPVRKFYNFKKGDIIKIMRQNGIAYRIVA